MYELFNEIDSNRDGYINEHELLEALCRGQPNSKFDFKTIQILMEKYDKNHDKTISYDEFRDLFVYLNNEYEKFICLDEDGSGEINSLELIHCLAERANYTLSDDFKNFIKKQLEENYRKKLTFDHYCQLVIKFDNLKRSFENSSKHQPFDHFLKFNLFKNFW